ncbi:NrsF family protein [Paragemmobacter straminiformis]|uniref:DUF1109 domain-containing protein n=1 Tax=Paragemmobacter straminiformis TaxID=2045119 RepID=A0A842IGU0_9RHOB|nr:DUF1109 domain-containing protein [Gemmobacter straminiformis]MBC2837638.1 DUF1109 domain-containing protein [Gemmobacter straminiformis]
MKTQDLIRRLAQDTPPPPFSERGVTLATVLAVVACTTAFLSLAGTRSDLFAAMLSPLVATKTLLPASLFILSLKAALRMARPDRAPSHALRPLLLLALVAALMWLRAFANLSPDQRFAEVGAFSLSECVGFITLLSVVPAAVLIARLQHGASMSPIRSGALAGLAAGSGAATGYSLFCVQDNPLFFVTWYGFAILLVSVLTALAGSRFLRW